MKYTTIDSIHDPMGAAIRDYHLRGKAARLRVMSSMFDEDEMPVDHLFRTFDDMPHLEQKASQYGIRQGARYRRWSRMPCLGFARTRHGC